MHDTSASGQTLFVEPLAALETNNRVRTLRLEEEREVERILEELSHHVGERADAIEANVEMLAALDLVVAKAQLARALEATVARAGRRSRRSNRTTDAIRCSASAQCRRSIRLDEDTRLLVISGPNMGGKSVSAEDGSGSSS